MSCDSVDVDLYADVVDTFNQNEENLNKSSLTNEITEEHQSADMLDEAIIRKECTNSVIQSTVNERDSTLDNISNSSKTFNSSTVQGRRASLYVQNLTWWTTDEDLKKCMKQLNVSDVIEIKFIENRVNGQSRGVAIITVGSENSANILLEKMSQMTIHGQKPDVSHSSRQNVHQMEFQNSFGNSRRESSFSNNIGLGQNSNNIKISQNSTNSGIPLTNPAAAAFFINHIAQQANLLQRPIQQRPSDMLNAVAQFTAQLRNQGNQNKSDYHQEKKFLNNDFHNSVDSFELQQLLERNKIISSNALAAAIQSAADSDYSNAIETLVTAISLIRQSKIANDDRSQVLISNLQETLRTIEEKSVISGKTSRNRSNSKSRNDPSPRNRSSVERRRYISKNDDSPYQQHNHHRKSPHKYDERKSRKNTHRRHHSSQSSNDEGNQHRSSKLSKRNRHSPPNQHRRKYEYSQQNSDIRHRR